MVSMVQINVVFMIESEKCKLGNPSPPKEISIEKWKTMTTKGSFRVHLEISSVSLGDKSPRPKYKLCRMTTD